MIRRVDFDLHGIVGIRVLDATEVELGAIRRQLGPIGATLDSEPDIIIRFVAHLPATTLRLAGIGETAEGDGSFLLLRDGGGRSARISLPMNTIGGRCEITIEHGARGVPHLIAIMNMTALARGVLPLHASAFTHRGRGILVTGWAKGGKSEVLLGFARRGARHVGDEWVYLDPETGRMSGIREPMRIWDWQLAQLPAYRRRLTTRESLRLSALRPLVAVITALERRGARSAAARILARVGPAARRRLAVQVDPRRLFDAESTPSARIDAVFLVANHSSPAIVSAPIGTDEIVERMTQSLIYERLALEALYLQFRFLLPGARSPGLEGAPIRERDLLRSTLEGIPTYIVHHPYPVPIQALCDAIEGLLPPPRTPADR